VITRGRNPTSAKIEVSPSKRTCDKSHDTKCLAREYPVRHESPIAANRNHRPPVFQRQGKLSAVDRPALPKEDLFDTSTMTFGEHLDELRRSLARAIIWLVAGALIALVFAAKPVVRMIQGPLETAIVEYNADRSLAKMGYDIEDEAVKEGELRRWMLKNGMAWELVYVLPKEFMKSITPTEGNGSAMGQFLDAIPDPSNFVPQLQLKRIEAGLNSHQVEEPFMIYLKASFVIGAVIASPGIFYHLWGFVAAGLYPHERKYVYMYLPFSVCLFIGGVALAFFAVLSYVLNFLLEFNSTLSVDLEPRLSYYMSFVLLLPLGFGIAFQLPLVMLFLQRIGIFETSAYENSWRIAVLVIAFLSMILTPADPYSMILLMIPLVILYFLGIGLCRYMPRGRGLGSAAYDPS
jgi:sec-independent protein translocase protein TatC